MKRALSFGFRVVLFTIKIPLILVLLLIGRWSLALWLWGRGRVCRWVARLYDADPGMYRRDRWKRTRIPVYLRSKDASGRFVCAVSGYTSDNLGEFHVDHRLSRAGFPMLAYAQWNLRLVRDKINVRKSDNLDVIGFIIFAARGRI